MREQMNEGQSHHSPSLRINNNTDSVPRQLAPLGGLKTPFRMQRRMVGKGEVVAVLPRAPHSSLLPLLLLPHHPSWEALSKLPNLSECPFLICKWGERCLPHVML